MVPSLDQSQQPQTPAGTLIAPEVSSSGPSQSPRLSPSYPSDFPPAIEEESESEDDRRRSISQELEQQTSSSTSSSSLAPPPTSHSQKKRLSISTGFGGQASEVVSPARRSGRGSGSFSFSRIFRRTPSASGKDFQAIIGNGDANLVPPKSATGGRRFSFHRSAESQRSVTPPSPDSTGLEMHLPLRPGHQVMPLSSDVLSSNPVSATAPNSGHQTPTHVTQASGNVSFMSKSKRSSTGLNLSRHFKRSQKPAPLPPSRSRANSFDANAKRACDAHNGQSVVACNHVQNGGEDHLGLKRSPWAYIPETGTGVKARRMSLSLPDDFVVATSELLKTYNYESRLGRHGNHLGKGATSTVVRMVRKDTGECVAVKEFRAKSKSDTQEQYEKKVKSEYTIAKSLHHPNIVETLDLCTHKSRWNHVMEYCGAGDLYSFVEEGFLKSADREKDRLCLFKQLVQGVNYLHSNGIAHRDIKLENLLVTKDSKLKITDFGVSEVFSGIHPGLREAGGVCGKNMGEVRMCKPGICGSEPYIAPEVLAKKVDYDPRPLDVWSSAVIMINLIFGSGLWSRAEPGQQHYDSLVRGWEKYEGEPLDSLTGDKYPCYKPFDLFVFPPVLRRILLLMLHPDPTKRITISEVVNHRWFRGLECCQPESYDEPNVAIDVSKQANLQHMRIAFHNHLPPVNTHSHFIGRTGH
ncbi:hypothetical protein TD95_003843 [Thielaviopsis punctulata]|uniref:Protein kinase domain-containing protein n=1 Tax=Thielaviopsis punctulata TaxID=72032 RepID=A0A0F4Z8D6_9PEZI|nr:hypothetical protein TD95_003843 [Thielaviopsis punctulata]